MDLRVPDRAGAVAGGGEGAHELERDRGGERVGVRALPPEPRGAGVVAPRGRRRGERLEGAVVVVSDSGAHQGTGNHAALYVSQDASGITVVDQWSGSGTIRLRRLMFLGKDKTGKYVDPSNNGDAFSVVE